MNARKPRARITRDHVRELARELGIRRDLREGLSMRALFLACLERTRGVMGYVDQLGRAGTERPRSSLLESQLPAARELVAFAEREGSAHDEN